MKLLKNNLKVIIAFIIGVILAGGIVYAAVTSANEVSYTTDKNTRIKNVADALNDLYNQKKEIEVVSYNANVSSGTSIDVEVGSYIYVSSVTSPHITNAETVTTNLKGGTINGISSWSRCFKAVDTHITITTDSDYEFSYIVLK